MNKGLSDKGLEWEARGRSDKGLDMGGIRIAAGFGPVPAVSQVLDCRGSTRYRSSSTP